MMHISANIGPIAMKNCSTCKLLEFHELYLKIGGAYIQAIFSEYHLVSVNKYHAYSC